MARCCRNCVDTTTLCRSDLTMSGYRERMSANCVDGMQSTATSVAATKVSSSSPPRTAPRSPTVAPVLSTTRCTAPPA
eukprot:4472003-Pyramimonas_sp.AAC.1